jgi:HD-GYP domain-containing protein (c-di-GMP phosphodiesterase class II)
MQQMELLPQELVQGMYVAELDRPWTETHFLFQGFKLSNSADIQFIRDNCAYVVIDLEKGEVPLTHRKSATNIATESHAQTSHSPHAIATISASSRQRLAGKKTSALALAGSLPRRHSDYADTASVEEEYVFAEQALGAVKSTYNDFLKAVRQSRAVDIEGLQATVSQMESSIVRNPDAMMLLYHLRNRDAYSYHHSISSSVLAIVFARHLGLSRQQIHDLGVGMLLADVGKVHLPKIILDAPRVLRESELAVVKKHVEHGVKVLTS